MARKIEKKRRKLPKWTLPLGIGLALCAAVAVVGTWQKAWAKQTRGTEDVVELTSMVGEKAPSFTLRNSEGEQYSIQPGDGSKYILIFHMGSI